MREIKFRGLTKGGEWVYGYFFINSIGDSKIIEIIDIPPHKGEPLGGADIKYHDVDFKTVGQLIGLKNRAGVDIYEGDIIKQGDNPKCWFAPREVLFKNGAWMGGGIRIFVEQDKWNYEGKVSNNEWEILGNIHQTPELLK